MRRLCCLLAVLRTAAADPAARDDPVALVQVALGAQRQAPSWPMYAGLQAMPMQPQQYFQPGQPSYPAQGAFAAPWQQYPGGQQYPAMQPLPPQQQPPAWGAPRAAQTPLMVSQQAPQQLQQMQLQQHLQQPQQPPQAWGAFPQAAQTPAAGDAQSLREQPAAAPEQKPTSEEQAPFYFQPDHGLACIQGPQEYVTAALEKLKKSPIGSLYAAANVTAGYCQDLEFDKWENEECFTGAALFHLDAAGSRELLLVREALEAKRFAERSGMKYEEVVAQLKEMCRSPTAGLLSVAPTERPRLMGPMAEKQPPYHFVPDNEMACVEGSPFYLSMALSRLQSHPVLGSHYANAVVEEGTCVALNNFNRGPFASSCYPGAVVFLGEQEHMWQNLIGFEPQLARRVAASEGTTMEAAQARLAEPCDDGSLSEDHFRELRGMSSALPTKTPPSVARIVPDNGMACLQGTPKYLEEALSKIKPSAYGTLFSKTSKPTDGFCRDAGFTLGSGTSITAGVGLVHNRCFPQAHLFWDHDPAHHNLSATAEWDIIGDEYAADYKQRVIEANLVCGARHETMFEAPPKAFFDF